MYPSCRRNGFCTLRRYRRQHVFLGQNQSFELTTFLADPKKVVQTPDAVKPPPARNSPSMFPPPSDSLDRWKKTRSIHIDSKKSVIDPLHCVGCLHGHRHSELDHKFGQPNPSMRTILLSIFETYSSASRESGMDFPPSPEAIRR